MGRFGGVMNRAALTSVDTYVGRVIHVEKVQGKGIIFSVKTSTGKVLKGVMYGGPWPDDENSLRGISVRLSRVGGRWCVL